MLVDTNIVIYACKPEHGALRQFISRNVPAVSEITRVETLGYHRLDESDRRTLDAFFAAATVLPVDSGVIRHAIHLRQQRKMSLGDALIAGTAIEHGLTLVTRNTKDFRWIADLGRLTLLDPFETGGSAGADPL